MRVCAHLKWCAHFARSCMHECKHASVHMHLRSQQSKGSSIDAIICHVLLLIDLTDFEFAISPAGTVCDAPAC